MVKRKFLTRKRKFRSLILRQIPAIDKTNRRKLSVIITILKPINLQRQSAECKVPLAQQRSIKTIRSILSPHNSCHKLGDYLSHRSNFCLRLSSLLRRTLSWAVPFVIAQQAVTQMHNVTSTRRQKMEVWARKQKEWWKVSNRLSNELLLSVKKRWLSKKIS